MTTGDTFKNLEKALVISQSETLEINKLLARNGFRIVSRDPDFILCYGGDGTILFAERKLPQIPKLIIKKSEICRKCDYTFHDLAKILRKIRNREFIINKKMKLETMFKQKRLVGLNEIQVHTRLPIQAIRFSLAVNGREYKDLIGDGVIVATPFGSTGYYQSTGGRKFKKGIGVSFNNLHKKKIRSFIAPEQAEINITVNRGRAWISADNNENLLELKDFGIVAIRKSRSVANFISIR
ncbi:MAG: NAD(+)/NADH kinase [Candidatus Bathyarchaeota archaeon]|nr:MAG: NAD(+)/NADH kinase [Candidatus Bathyarchaeota archaeon]